MMNPTELDVFSCALDGATLIEASAGTGKTWNICGLYLRLLLERELPVQQILVVTFTKAATAELRQRIRARIAETLAFLAPGSTPAGDPFVPDLIRTLVERHGRTPQRIGELLNLALQTFDEAAIFTIHGFCQRALADTPFTAGMPFATELVADDSAYLLQAAYDFWRRHIGIDSGGIDELPPELAAYLLENQDTPARLARLLRRHLAKPRAHYLWPQPVAIENARPRIAQLFGAAQALWATREGEIRTLLAQAQPDLKATHAADKIAPALAECAAFFGAAAAPALNPRLSGVQMKLLRQSVLDGAAKKNKPVPTHPFFSQLDTLLAQLPALQKAEQEALPIARLGLVRALLQEAAPRLRQQKRELRLASYDDLLFNLAEALEGGAYPWLAAALRTRYPAALIDEFQDTDPLQWAIFAAIYGASAAPMFLVGDPKQAIYSFRNADLHTYLHAKQQTGASHTLSGNQRACAGLIAGLNALFGANPAAFMLPGLDYQPVQLGAKPRAAFIDHSEPRADLQLWMLPGDDSSAIERGRARSAAIQATAAEIARLIRAAQAGQITLDGRALQPGDIAILVRSHAQGSDVRAALGALGIGSVELSQASVFDSSDAADLECVLCAILEPTRTGLLLAALATPLLGRDAAAIAALGADEKRLLQQLDHFTAYRELWSKRGIGFMLRQLLAEENVSRRMLCRPDGERRLTNLLHLAEQLHQASVRQAAPETLLRWLQDRRREGGDGGDESAQLRLESDQNLVQIVTIHKSKGLEYPIVFCPFLWIPGPNQGGIEGLEYHAEDGNDVIDLRLEPDTREAAKQVIKLERAAEDLRLIYVALTRAAQRCYLVAGTYARTYRGTPSLTEGMRNLLNWLVAGNGQTPQQWLNGKLDLADINRRWRALAAQAAPHIGLAPLPMMAGTPVGFPQPAADALLTPAPPPAIHAGWRSGSFSLLTRDVNHGAAGERSASDHDARIAPVVPAATPAAIARNDILRFPRGPAAGDCLHAVFETIEFDHPQGWPAAIARALSRHPQPAPAGADAVAWQAAQTAMILQMLENVMGTPLQNGNGMQLRSVPLGKRLTELEFRLPARRINAGALNRLLKQHGYQVPELSFRDLDGYLNGFIDLVFEHRQRFYIVDWKSNYLGASAADYGTAAIGAAMAEHRYHLQYLLYSVALQRYLRQRLPGYRRERDFGGVLYLFVRGMRPGWVLADGRQAGVFFHQPSAAILDGLEQLIGPVAGTEAA